MAAKASLAYIGQAAEAAVQTQLADPTPFVSLASAKRMKVSGIDVLVEDPVAERRARLKSYQEDAQALRAKLDAAGVTYLTILPSTAWNRIAEDANLFRFQPQEDGSVFANADILNDAIAHGEKSGQWMPFVLLTGGALAGYASVFALLQSTTDFNVLVTGALALIGGAIGGVLGGGISQLIYGDEDAPNPSAAASAEYQYLKKAFALPKEKLLRMLFPVNKVLTSGVPLKIELPAAPMDAQQNLRAAKAAGLTLTLDTVAEAITFKEPPLKAFVDTRVEHWQKRKVEFEKRKEDERKEREARRKEWLDNLSYSLDPIVTTEHGLALAVIVQYGDFPVEQKIVDQVINSAHLI